MPAAKRADPLECPKNLIFTDTYGFVDLDSLVTATDANDLARWNAATSIQPMKTADHADKDFGTICGTAYFSGDINVAFVLMPLAAPAAM